MSMRKGSTLTVATLASLIASVALAQSSNDTQALAARKAAPAARPALFYLGLRKGVLRTSTRGGEPTVLVSPESAGTGPDGITLDVKAGHIYWTTMGKVAANDGAVMRADLDGRNVTAIVTVGSTYTPKQLKLDPVHRKLYWSDREGMRVMRSNLDGSNIETLVVTGEGDEQRQDASRWCVGIAIDIAGEKIYWSQKGGDNSRTGTIKRADLDIPEGQTAATRTDVEVLFEKLAEPIDLELDVDTRLLYWTDRGDNTISRAPLDVPKNAKAATRNDREIIVRNVGEAIGITLDTTRDRLYYTSLDGVVGFASLDGRKSGTLLTGQGALTGIVLLDD